MGIWIRSQDRKTITNANDIYIRLSGKGCTLCTGKGMDLGVYSSEEKSMKVLDLIQNKIIEIEKSKFFGMEETDFIEPLFQLPYDSEV